MSHAIALKPARIVGAPRKIVHRTKGRRHGAITRLMSPGDLGEVLKPFVFLDHVDMKNATYTGPGLHPHSGIVTVTHLFEGSIRYEDTTGATGVLPAGGVMSVGVAGDAIFWASAHPSASAATKTLCS